MPQAFAGPSLAIGVQSPAALVQDLVGAVYVEGISIQTISQDVLGLLILPHSGGIGTIDHGAPASAEGVGEAGAVQQHGNGMTDFLELGGSHVAEELDLAVTSAVILHRLQLGASVDHIHDGVHFGAIGNAFVHVDLAGLQGVSPGALLGLADDHGLDGRLLAFEVASIGGVDLQSGLAGGSIVAHQVVGASGNHVGSSGLGSIEVILNAFAVHHDLLAVLGEVAAFAIVSHVIAFANPERDVPGADARVSIRIVVLRVLGNDGHGQGVVVNDLQARQHIGGAVPVVHAASNRVSGGSSELQLAGSRRADQQQPEHIVLNGDGLTVVVGQAFVDGDGVGGGAIFVVHTLPVLQDGGVLHVVAFLVGYQGVVVIDHSADHHVGSAIGYQTIGPVASDIGGGTEDQLVLANSGFSGSLGGCLSGGLVGGAFGRSLSPRGVVATGLTCSQGENHDHSQQQS